MNDSPVSRTKEREHHSTGRKTSYHSFAYPSKGFLLMWTSPFLWIGKPCEVRHLQSEWFELLLTGWKTYRFLKANSDFLSSIVNAMFIYCLELFVFQTLRRSTSFLMAPNSILCYSRRMLFPHALTNVQDTNLFDARFATMFIGYIVRSVPIPKTSRNLMLNLADKR